MKKVFYGILLAAELALSAVCMSLLWSNTAYIAMAIIIAIWVALLIWVLLKLRKADDAAIKRKLYRRLALVMVSPVVMFVIAVIIFIIGLSMVI